MESPMSPQNVPPIPIRDFRPPNINFGTVGLIVLLLLLAGLIWSTVFTVEPEEVGVVLTFGKYTPRGRARVCASSCPTRSRR